MNLSDLIWIGYLGLWLAFGVAGGLIARSRGRSLLLWVGAGLLFGFPALILLALLPVKRNEKICPQCAERVADAAKICPWCAYRFSPEKIETE